MADYWAIREGMALRPFGAESATVFGKLPFGKVVHVEVRQPRNGPHHRLYWVLCKRIADAVGCEDEDISYILKKRTGHVKQIKTRSGAEERVLSIAWAKMDQIAFDKFWDKCLHVIETEFGIVRPDVLAVVDDILHPVAA